MAARSPAECPIDQGSFLWYTFVAMFSVLLNFVPRSLEIYLARRGFVQESRLNRRWQLRVRRLKDAGFWAFSFCLSGLHLVVVSAFLANMAEAGTGLLRFTVLHEAKEPNHPKSNRGLGCELWQCAGRRRKVDVHLFRGAAP